MALHSVALSNRGPSTIAVTAVFLGINTFFIALRCYTKAKISKNFSFNDVFMIVTVIIYAGLLTLVIYAVRNGIGSHIGSVDVSQIGNDLKCNFILEIIYVTLTSIMKASLAITLMQWANHKFQRYLLWTAIVLDAFICLVVIEYFLVQCAPISYAWTLVDPTSKGVCLPAKQQVSIGYALCSTTITLDMIFLFVPFFMIRGRSVNSRVKMYIYGIFVLGVAASVANIIRLVSLSKLKDSSDPLYDAAPVFLWSALEVSIGISVAGIIELQPLMKKFRVKGFEASPEEFDEIRSVRLQSMDK